MKHDADIQRATEAVLSGATVMGLRLDEAMAHAVIRHTLMVAERNRDLNLTRVDRLDEAVPVHILDSLSAHGVVQAAPAGVVADIGSGAGYPGVPLCIATGRTTHLVESVAKKAAFLEDVVRDLGLPASVFPLRSEEMAERFPAGYAVVTARAVAELAVLAELASPLLAAGGLLVAMKANVSNEEVDAGVRAGLRCGMRLDGVVPVSVPGLDATRNLVVMRREGASEVRLPRRPGMAKKRPLV